MKLFLVFPVFFLSLNIEKVATFNIQSVFKNVARDPSPAANNVTINATWTFINEMNITVVRMIVYNLKSSQYAAMGLGQNQSMGEAHVFMCERFANDTIVIQRFINPEGHRPPVPAGSEQGGLFTPLPSKFIDGIVICRFTLSDFGSQMKKQPNTLRPLSPTRKYHPLFSVGMLNSTGDPQYHNGREPQSGLVQLNENQHLIYHQNNTKLFATHETK